MVCNVRNIQDNRFTGMRKYKLRYCDGSKQGTKEGATDMLQLRPVSIRLRMKGDFKCMVFSNQIEPRKSCCFLPSAASSARVVQVRFKFCICDVLTFFTNKLMHYYSMKRSTKKHRNAQESIRYGENDHSTNSCIRITDT